MARTKIENKDDVRARVTEALKYISADRLILAPDCGLGMLPTSIIKEKLKIMCEVAQEFWNPVSRIYGKYNIPSLKFVFTVTTPTKPQQKLNINWSWIWHENDSVAHKPLQTEHHLILAS